MMFGKKKNYLEYRFLDDKYDSNFEEMISEILVKSKPKTSCWWSSLSMLIGGWKSWDEYIKVYHRKILRNTPHQYFDASDDNIGTAKHCPAVLDVLSDAFLIKSPSDMLITINSEGMFSCSFANKLIDIREHYGDQFLLPEKVSSINLFKDKICLKFRIPIEIRTDQPFTFLQPMYHNNVWYDVAVGTMSKKYSMKGGPLNIIVFVDKPKSGEIDYKINAGDVLAYMWFPKKVELLHTDKHIIDEQYKRKWSTKSIKLSE